MNISNFAFYSSEKVALVHFVKKLKKAATLLAGGLIVEAMMFFGLKAIKNICN